MRRKVELACVLSAVPFVVLFFVGLLLLADFVPPPSPDMTAQQVAQMYIDDGDRIRAGLLLAFLGTTCFFFFGCAIATQTGRIRDVSPTLKHVQVASVGAGSLIIVFPIMMWCAAAYRPAERPATETQLITDLGWMIFVAGYVPYIAWAIAVGLAILCDPDARPLYPRWAGYLSIFVALVQIPPSLLVFFTTGPFAWDGLISWWVTMFDFFIWVVVMTVLTVRAINAPHPATEASAPLVDAECLT